MLFKSLFIEYSKENVQYEITLFNSIPYQNEHFRLEFLIEDNAIVIDLILPFTLQLPIIINSAKLTIHHDYTTHQYTFANRYQSWTHSTMLKPADKINPLPKLLSTFTRQYGDYNFSVLKDYPPQYSWHYIALQHCTQSIQYKSLSDKITYSCFIPNPINNTIEILLDTEGLNIHNTTRLFHIDKKNKSTRFSNQFSEK